MPYNEKEMTRIEQVRTTAKKKNSSLSAVYVRLPKKQVEWMKKQADKHGWTIGSVYSVMIQDAMDGKVYEKA